MKNRYLKNVSSLRLESDRCTGCGMCVEVCPHGVLSLSGRKAVIRDADVCMECSACEKNCPFSALKVNQGVGCAAAVISGFMRGTEPSCDCSGDSENSSSGEAGSCGCGDGGCGCG